MFESRWLRLIVLVVGCTSSLVAQSTLDRSFNLSDSVKTALNNSQAILSAREDEEVALQRIRESQSLFFPKIDLSANASKYHTAGNSSLLLQPYLGSTIIPNSDRQNYYTTRASIYQTVYEGGRARNLWRQARVSYERTRTMREALQVQVTSGAKIAYYTYLAAQKTKNQTLKRFQQLAPLFQNPPSDGLEAIRLEHERTFWRQRVADSDLQEEEAKLQFLRTLNLEMNLDVALQGDLQTEPVHLDLQKLLAWSSQYRYELRQTEYQEQFDSLGVGLSLAERQPTISLGATYERAGNGIELPIFNWAGTLSVNFPVSISDLIYGWAKVRERKAQFRKATLGHAEASDQVQLDVRRAYAQYLHWQEELLPREQSVRFMELELQKLRVGSTRTRERIEAERLVLDAQLSYLKAVQGHLCALAELERAVGHPLPSVL